MSRQTTSENIYNEIFVTDAISFGNTTLLNGAAVDNIFERLGWLEDQNPTAGPPGPRGPTGPTGPVSPYAYAAFSSTVTQPIATVGGNPVPTVLTYNNTDVNVGSYILTDSSGAIQVPRAGVYEFIPSIVFAKTGGGISVVWFYFTKNGSPLADSGSQLSIAGNNNETIGTLSYMEALLTGDRIGVYFYGTDTTTRALYSAGPIAGVPASPSIITTVKYLGPSS